MIKKIKSPGNLREEKARMKGKQRMIENRISEIVDDIKSSRNLYSVAEESLSFIKPRQQRTSMNQGSMLKRILVFAATLLAAELVEMAGNKVEKYFKR